MGDSNSVTYYTDTDADPYFVPQKHQLTYDSTWKGGRGAITESVYTPDQTAAQGPPWTYTQAPKTNLLAEDVVLQPGKAFLTYYPFNDATTGIDESASALATPLSQTITGTSVPANSMAKVIRIDVAFRVLPGRSSGSTGPPVGTQNDATRDNDFDTSVYVRSTDYTDTDAKNRVWGPRCD